MIGLYVDEYQSLKMRVDFYFYNWGVLITQLLTHSDKWGGKILPYWSCSLSRASLLLASFDRMSGPDPLPDRHWKQRRGRRDGSVGKVPALQWGLTLEPWCPPQRPAVDPEALLCNIPSASCLTPGALHLCQLRPQTTLWPPEPQECDLQHTNCVQAWQQECVTSWQTPQLKICRHSSAPWALQLCSTSMSSSAKCTNNTGLWATPSFQRNSKRREGNYKTEKEKKIQYNFRISAITHYGRPNQLGKPLPLTKLYLNCALNCAFKNLNFYKLNCIF